MITWSRLAEMKLCEALPGSRHCYKLYINYVLRLHIKRFIPAKHDLSFVQPGSCFAGTKFFHVIASFHLYGIKKLIKNVHRWWLKDLGLPEWKFNPSSRDRLHVEIKFLPGIWLDLHACSLNFSLQACYLTKLKIHRFLMI